MAREYVKRRLTGGRRLGKGRAWEDLMRTRLLVIVLLFGSPAWATDPPKVADLVARMKAVLEPEQASLRTLTISTTSPLRSQTTRVVAGQARKRTAEGERVVTVMLGQDGPRGISWLIQETPQQTTQWLWLPVVGRVRKLIPLPGYESFVGSDFTFADLGLVDLHSTYSLLGEDTVGGRKVYRIQAVPASTWFYSRIVTTVDAVTGFPLMRDYYDPANQRWKVETFDRIAEVQGVPTVLHQRMENLQEKGSTDLEVSGVQYGAAVPDALFAVDQLPRAAASPLWATLGAP